MEKGSPDHHETQWYAKRVMGKGSPPVCSSHALHRVTATSRTSNNVDCILDDLQYYYGDLHTAITTLTQCQKSTGSHPRPSTLQRSSTLPCKITQSDSGRLYCTDRLFRHSWGNHKPLLPAILPDFGGSPAIQSQDG